MLLTDSQAQILEAIGRGDKQVFEQVFRAWYVRLCLYAETIVRDRDLAEDLVQNVFCGLWERRQELQIRESMKNYLYRSVYNAALNSLRHEKVKRVFLAFIEKHGIKEENNIEDLMNKENQDRMVKELNRVIGRLPEQCREIFMLSRFDGRKSSEIALALNISVRTVETQLYRAMKHLREELSHLKNSGIFFLFLFR